MSSQKGIINTIAGTGTANFGRNGGIATSANLFSPFALCANAAGNVNVADQANCRVRMISDSGKTGGRKPTPKRNDLLDAQRRHRPGSLPWRGFLILPTEALN